MKVYVAHRLYAAHDRWLAGHVAERIRSACGAEVFLPYCDTDEHGVSPPGKSYKLFLADLERLPEADVLVALLHGPSYDDGVCFEVGFAHALGIPVLGVTSDFLTFAPVADPATESDFADPILDAICFGVVRQPDRKTRVDLGSATRYAKFSGEQEEVCESLARQVAERIAGSPRGGVGRPTVDREVVYVEPGFYATSASTRELIEAVGHEGRRHVASRTGHGAAARDLAAMARASVVVVDGHGPETPPGGAIALGMAAATDRRSLLYYRGPVTSLAHGREPTDRNLMVLYGATACARLPAGVRQAVEAWIGDGG